MTAPTQVWVVVQKDLRGKPRGFEKSRERFHFTWEAAEAERLRCPVWLHDGLAVVDCVIMGAEEYEHITGIR